MQLMNKLWVLPNFIPSTIQVPSRRGSATPGGSSRPSSTASRRAPATIYKADMLLTPTEQVSASLADIEKASLARETYRNEARIVISNHSGLDVYSAYAALAKLKLRFLLLTVGPYLPENAKNGKEGVLDDLAKKASELALGDYSKSNFF